MGAAVRGQAGASPAVRTCSQMQPATHSSSLDWVSFHAIAATLKPDLALAGAPCQTLSSWASPSSAGPPRQQTWATWWLHCKACSPARPAKVTPLFKPPCTQLHYHLRKDHEV